MWYNVNMARYITLLIFFIAMSIILLFDPFNFSKEVKEVIVPWATLVLAFVAILTILHSDIKEGKRRTLNRLADILDWAEDIVRLTHVVETPEPTDLGSGADTYERLRYNDKINDFNRLRITGDHIRILSLRVDKELYVTARSLISAVDDLLRENWGDLDLINTRNQLAEHETRIYGIAKLLINEITNRLER